MGDPAALRERDAPASGGYEPAPRGDAPATVQARPPAAAPGLGNLVAAGNQAVQSLLVGYGVPAAEGPPPLAVRFSSSRPWVAAVDGSADPAVVAQELYGVPVAELVATAPLVDIPSLGIRIGTGYQVHPELLLPYHRSEFERLMQELLEADVRRVKDILFELRIDADDEAALIGTVRWWSQTHDIRTRTGRTWFDTFIARLHHDRWYRDYGLWKGSSRSFYDLLVSEVEERAGELTGLVAQGSREFGAYRPAWAAEEPGAADVNADLVDRATRQILDELAGYTGSKGSKIITDTFVGLPPPEQAAVLRTMMSRYDETDWTGIFGRYGEAWEGGMLYFLFEDLTGSDRDRLAEALKAGGVLPAPTVDALMAGRGWGGKYLPYTTRKAHEAAEYWADLTVGGEGPADRDRGRVGEVVVSVVAGAVTARHVGSLVGKWGAGTMLAFSSLWLPETAGSTASVLTGARLFPAVGGLHPTIGRGLAVGGAGLTSYTMTTALLHAATGTDASGRPLGSAERWSQVLLAASSALLLGAGFMGARPATAPPPAGAGGGLARPGVPARPGAGTAGGRPPIEFRIIGENPQTGTITAAGRNLATGETVIAQINRFTGNGSAMSPTTGEVIPIVGGRLAPVVGHLPGAAATGTPAPGALTLAGGGPRGLPPPTGPSYFGHPVPPATGAPVRSAAGAGREAIGSGLVDVPAGRLGLQTHNRAPSVRESLGVTGADLESAHVIPQTVGARIPGYSPGRALTVLLPRPAHQAFDRGWVPDWNAAVAAGRPMNAGQVNDLLVGAIDGIPHQHLPPAAKATLIWRLHLELFGELGLTPGTPILP